MYDSRRTEDHFPFKIPSSSQPSFVFVIDKSVTKIALSTANKPSCGIIRWLKTQIVITVVG